MIEAGDKQTKKSGFSIIEILVVISIIVLIAAVLIFSYRGNEKNYVLNQAAQIFASNVRRAQNMALSGVKEGCATPNGYGIYIKDSSSYILYCCNDSGTTYSCSHADIETFSFSGNLSISPTAKEVFFVPPDPTAYINGLAGSPNSQNFTLSIAGITKDVVVYFSGKVEIE